MAKFYCPLTIHLLFPASSKEDLLFCKDSTFFLLLDSGSYQCFCSLVLGFVVFFLALGLRVPPT
jgi:hypothetical protein